MQKPGENMNYRILLIITVLLSFASPCLAWHKDRPAGAANQPEVSEAQLQEQQKFQAVQGEVGVVPGSTRETAVVEGTESNDQASEVVGSHVTDSKGADVISKAKREMSGPEPRNPFEFASILVLILGAIYWYVRRWANQTIPPMANPST